MYLVLPALDRELTNSEFSMLSSTFIHLVSPIDEVYLVSFSFHARYVRGGPGWYEITFRTENNCDRTAIDKKLKECGFRGYASYREGRRDSFLVTLFPTEHMVLTTDLGTPILCLPPST